MAQHLRTAYYRELFPIDEQHNPSFCGDYPDIEYGRILIEDTGYDLILGPVFSVPITDEVIRQAVKGAAVSPEHRERFIEMMYAVPRLSQTQFAQYLALLYQCVNNKTIDMGKFFSEDDVLRKLAKPVTGGEPAGLSLFSF